VTGHPIARVAAVTQADRDVSHRARRYSP
jgi:hypothetical protein